MRLGLVEFHTLFMVQVQDEVGLDIKKREDQALISISTILKFSALSKFQLFYTFG